MRLHSLAPSFGYDVNQYLSIDYFPPLQGTERILITGGAGFMYGAPLFSGVMQYQNIKTLFFFFFIPLRFAYDR